MLATVSFQEPPFARETDAVLVIGVQHHKLGQILLAIFDPKIPRVGGNRNIAVKSMEVRFPQIFLLPFEALYLLFTGTNQIGPKRTMRDWIVQSLDPTRDLHCIDGNRNM